MFTAKKSSSNKLQKRRSFLSRTAAIGSMALFGTSMVPVQAGKKSKRNKKVIRVGNATVNDFSRLVGKQFKLSSEDGTTSRAELIEANAPSKRLALRFRREQFSIVFDVPDDVELVQGRYRIKHSKIGSMDLFMVPVDLPGKFNRLEAVFT